MEPQTNTNEEKNNSYPITNIPVVRCPLFELLGCWTGLWLDNLDIQFVLVVIMLPQLCASFSLFPFPIYKSVPNAPPFIFLSSYGHSTLLFHYIRSFSLLFNRNVLRPWSGFALLPTFFWFLLSFLKEIWPINPLVISQFTTFFKLFKQITTFKKTKRYAEYSKMLYNRIKIAWDIAARFADFCTINSQPFLLLPSAMLRF